MTLKSVFHPTNSGTVPVLPESALTIAAKLFVGTSSVDRVQT
jgi:hypothetical protein